MTIITEILPEYSPGFDYKPRTLSKRTITPQGRVQEVILAANPVYSGSISYSPRPLAVGLEVKAIHQVCVNNGYGCLFFDVSDHELEDEPIGTGDGAETQFQIRKAYAVQNWVSYRKIVRPIHNLAPFTFNGTTYEDTISVKVDGVLVDPADYSIAETTGIITFDVAPLDTLPVTVSGHFLNQVFFVDKVLPWRMEGGGTVHIEGLRLQEVKA